MTRRIYRVTTFVPPDCLDSVLEAVAREGDLLRFGPYEQWAWWSPAGVEQFRPLDGATPSAGEPGRLERVSSVQLELALPADPELLDRVVTAGLIPAHPWEVPVIFVEEASNPLP